MASKPTKYQLDILKKMSKGVDVNKALTTGYQHRQLLYSLCQH